MVELILHIDDDSDPMCWSEIHHYELPSIREAVAAACILAPAVAWAIVEHNGLRVWDSDKDLV